MKTLSGALFITAIMLLGRPTPGTFGATTIFVDQGAGGSNNGTSWANAYTDLQVALAAAVTGDEIWVARGTYTPSIADRSASFEMKDGVGIYGGFAGTETSRDQRDPAANHSILSGEIGGIAATDNSYHVVEAPDVDAQGVLDGFTVARGFADGVGLDAQGAGIFVGGGNESGPTLRNLVVMNNHATTGGGMFIVASSPTVERSSFIANVAAGSGGGIATDSSGAELRELSFTGNQSDAGGGLASFAGGITLDGATFIGNVARIGGGLYNLSPFATVANAYFRGNFGWASGGALDIRADAQLRNLTIESNRSRQGSGIYTEQSPVFSGILVRDDDVSLDGGAPVYKNSLIESGCITGISCPGLLTSDPKLGPMTDAANGLLYRPLLDGSPAIDAGQPSGCPAADIAGATRPVDGNVDGAARCDIGAAEFRPASPRVGFAVDATTVKEANRSRKVRVRLTSKYPDPVTVNYAVVGGNASPGKDFVLDAGTLTFLPLTTSQPISVQVKDDLFVERPESIVIRLSSPTNATIGERRAHRLGIEDNEPRVRCGGKLATIAGTGKAETIAGTPARDIIVAGAGNDTIDAGGGDDLVCGGDGNDTLRGGEGADDLRGDDGSDRLGGGKGTGDRCDGGPGSDALLPKAGCETVLGVP